MSSNVNLWKSVIPLQTAELGKKGMGKEKNRDCHCCHYLDNNRASKGVRSPS